MGLEKLGDIRALITDVDGVLTNGAIVVGAQGETKIFNVRDGLGIKLWQAADRRLALLSGRASKPVEQRASELGIDIVKVGRLDKQTAFGEILAALDLPADQTAYIGDDLPDLAPLRLAGIGFCPHTAVDEVKAAADHVVPLAGGEGVFRHVVEIILKAQDLWRHCVARFEVQDD